MAVITVSQLNNYLKRYIDQNTHLSEIWIKGEISNFKKHYSGHLYFTLKDEYSSLKAIVFKSSAASIKFLPGDGMKVLAFGKVTVFEAAGVYQLYIEQLIPDGVGELYAAFEQLKIKLGAQGLFDESRKKALPAIPKKIGVITSVTGAAIKDILNVLKRRFPISDVCIYPAQVQGVGAADSICEALEFFDKSSDCDVIILARGGGSIEDLWSFNEEKTARAIFNCTIPVISGIGHETDYTISDFVADKRAPTPSAAAEIAVPSVSDLKRFVGDLTEKNYKAIINIINSKERAFELINGEHIYAGLLGKIKMHILETDKCCVSIMHNYELLLNNLYSKLSKQDATLKALDPRKVLERGYAILSDCNGNTVTIDTISENDSINAQLKNGYAQCFVQKVVHYE